MSGQADPEEVEMLQLEENIWALLQAVMAYVHYPVFVIVSNSLECSVLEKRNRKLLL